MLQTTTIQQTRAELKKWGNFWRRYEVNLSTISVTFAHLQQSKARPKSKNFLYRKKRVIEYNKKEKKLIIHRELTATATATRSVNLSREIILSDDIALIDNIIATLAPECRKALKNKYIRKADEKGIWIDRAERIVMCQL